MFGQTIENFFPRMQNPRHRGYLQARPAPTLNIQELESPSSSFYLRVIHSAESVERLIHFWLERRNLAFVNNVKSRDKAGGEDE
jgi:hypothetical protein